MKFKIISLISIIAVISISSCKSKSIEEKTTFVSEDDREMNQAIETARSRLNEFWAMHDNPKNGESDFMLKVKITDKNGVEHFWCTDLKKENKKITGLIGNDPEIVKSVQFQDKITINENDITDWAYLKNGRMYGNFTVRALFKTMTKEELSEVKEFLSDNP